jgi:DcmR-like sensory protein
MGKTRSRRPEESAKELSDALTVIRGDHFMGLYATDNERLRLSVNFLLEGLREGSICFLIGLDSANQAILAELKKNRPGVADDIADGRLIVAEHQTTARDQFKFFEDHMSAAEKVGVRTFRLFADMIGARQRMSIEQTLELERGFDEVIVHKHQMTAICAYDVRHFSGVEILAALRSHPGSVRYDKEDTGENAAK